MRVFDLELIEAHTGSYLGEDDIGDCRRPNNPKTQKVALEAAKAPRRRPIAA